jgi:hypothetical protein
MMTALALLLLGQPGTQFENRQPGDRSLLPPVILEAGPAYRTIDRSPYMEAREAQEEGRFELFPNRPHLPRRAAQRGATVAKGVAKGAARVARGTAAAAVRLFQARPRLFRRCR